MNYCHTIYYNLNYIKNDLINLIQKFENTLQEISSDFNINHLRIQFLTQNIQNFNKSHLNNDIILQKIEELLLYNYDINFLIQFWFVISIELYNNYMFINNIYQQLINHLQNKKFKTINTLKLIENIKDKYYQNSILANYQFLILSSSSSYNSI